MAREKQEPLEADRQQMEKEQQEIERERRELQQEVEDRWWHRLLHGRPTVVPGLSQPEHLQNSLSPLCSFFDTLYEISYIYTLDIPHR